MEKSYEPPSVLKAGAPVTLTTYAGWIGHNYLEKSHKHNLSSLVPPKGEMKSSFSWTSLFKRPTSSTLCFGEPILGKLCSLSSSTLWDPTLATLANSIKKSSYASPSTFLFLTHLFILELHSLCQVLPLKQTRFPTATPV